MKNLFIVCFLLLALNNCGGGGGSSEQIASNINDNNISDDDNETDSNEDNTTVKECEATYSHELLQGRELYNNHCKVCHASDAKSGVFDIRGVRSVDITLAMEEVPDMVELKLIEKVSIEDRDLIALYLQTLVTDPEAEFGNICDENAAFSKELLGEKLFFDANLSLTKSISCASCHNPGKGFVDARFKVAGDTNPVEGALSVGDDGMTLGGRNAPTVLYTQFIPVFSKNTAGEYIGGQFYDGRAATLKKQAKGPLLDPTEMMMPDQAAVVSRVTENDQYVSEMEVLYGNDIFDDVQLAFDAIAESIAAYEQTDIFAPFSSNYDRSKLDSSDPDYYQMTALEQEGYSLFFDRSKTNCSLCHAIDASSERSTQELFTNFEYGNIGTPKNREALLIRDGNTDHIDLGLGGRSDINDSSHYGKMRVPTLRNVAITGPYMSNGVFKNLRTVLEFHSYMSGSGNHHLNPETDQPWEAPEVNTTIAYQELQATEPLSSERLDAIEAFLKLLTDN